MLEIIRANIQHLNVLGPLFDQYRRFYGQVSDPARARDFLRARIERNESGVFVAELDGKPAGFTQLYPLFSSIRMSRIWILNDLFVAEFARRRGIARALLKAAREYAEQSGASELMLQTHHDNRAAQALYEREGWRREDAYYWYAFKL
jgi:GNAT superfamily N-acetyltransferase